MQIELSKDCFVKFNLSLVADSVNPYNYPLLLHQHFSVQIYRICLKKHPHILAAPYILYVSLSSRIFGSPHHKFQQPHSHAYPTPHTDKCVEEQFASGKVTTHLITNGMSAFVAKQIVAHKTLRGWKSSKWTYFAIYLFGCCWKAFLRRQQLQQQHWTGSSLATTQRSHKWHGVVLWQPVRRWNSAHTGALEPVEVVNCFVEMF